MKVYRGATLIKQAFFIAAITALTACRPTVSPDGNFTLADFNEINLDSTNSQLLTDDVAIGTGVMIRIVNDSILAVKTIRSDNQVVLYNTLSGEIRPAVAKGSGPLEMIRVAGMSATPEGTLWIVGSGDNKVMTAAWNDSTVTTDERFTAQTAIVNGTPDARGGAIVLPVGDCTERVALIDGEGKIVETFGSFPQIEIPDSIMYNNFTFQADIAYSPDHNIAVVSNKSWPEIEIYGLADNTSRHIFGPVVSDARMEEQPTPMGSMYIQKPMWFMFDGVVAGPESFFVGYIGVKVEKDEDFNRTINRILEFDYEGNPLNCYTFGDDIVAFDVDSKNGIIYTIENRPDPAIIKYAIPRK